MALTGNILEKKKKTNDAKRLLSSRLQLTKRLVVCLVSLRNAAQHNQNSLCLCTFSGEKEVSNGEGEKEKEEQREDVGDPGENLVTEKRKL